MSVIVALVVGCLLGMFAKGVNINININGKPNNNRNSVEKDSEKKIYTEDSSSMLPDEVKSYFEQNSGMMK